MYHFHDRLFSSFAANPHRKTGNPISEKSPYLLKVNTQFYMEADGNHMFTVQKLKFKLYLF